MRIYALAFCAGLSCLNFFSILPNYKLLLLAIVMASIFSFYYRHFIYILVVLAGVSWGVLFANKGLDNRITSDLEGVPVMVDGRISGLPKKQGKIVQFDFQVDCLRLQSSELSPARRECEPAPHTIRLNWYGQAPEIIPGDLWHLKVKLKKGVGFVNPAGFDYEKWLFAHGIGARGYVLSKFSYKNQYSSDKYWIDLIKNPSSYVDYYRNKVANRIDTLQISELSKGFIKALTIGDKRGITTAQYEVLAATGTSHLLAVSGLHVGLVAGFVYFILYTIFRYLLPQNSGLTAIKISTLGGLLVATLYCALAGFSLPTVRAWIMLLCFAQALLRDNDQSVWDSYFLALFFVNLTQPFSVFETGFWLSFIAVAVILFVLTGRIKNNKVAKENTKKNNWINSTIQMLSASWQVQWVIFVGLLPLLIMYYGNIVLLAPAFNFVALPLVAWFVIPFSLLGVAVLFMAPTMAILLFKLAGSILHFFWISAEFVAHISMFQIPFQKPVSAIFVITIGACFLLLMPRKLPMRGFVFILSLPLLLNLIAHQRNKSFAAQAIHSNDALQNFEMEFTMLDVGQGLSATVRTKNHLLIYDTGPPIGRASDAGSAVLYPYISKLGLSVADKVILSHNDADHVGGAVSLIKSLEITELSASKESLVQLMGTIPDQLASIKKVSNCNKPKYWSWDGVNFLQFSAHSFGIRFNDRNNRSCLLKVWGKGFSVLFSGDIEKKAEISLVSGFRRWVAQEHLEYSLQSDILIAPHHGSKTSSSFTFLNAVKPLHVLFSAGYRSQFGHPHTNILERYNKKGVMAFNTAESGALTYRFSSKSSVYSERVLGRKPSNVVHSLKPIEHRKAYPYFWRW